ncbi:Uncharacterised protein [Streptococcus sanguinis]|uniref:Uncharacterized protein n=1 Tax=Streptococcus sanguinis TaxID=1305 RepID=A0AAJ5NN92_STRSA|nr:Uncharacterised protein [Streptococcus sanguinis]
MRYNNIQIRTVSIPKLNNTIRRITKQSYMPYSTVALVFYGHLFIAHSAALSA